jgi:hypothetical protein
MLMRKNIITLVSSAFIALNSYAQAPQFIPYQAVARDAAGLIVPNQSIGLRFTIHDQTIAGPALWQEAQTIVSNAMGLLVLNLGANQSLTVVDWSNGLKFLQVEMDIAGGNNYSDMGTQQMMSVPYALFAAQSETSNTSNTVANLPAGTAVGNTMYWDGTQWVVSSANIYNAGSNVGIGTSSPAQQLDVNGNIGLSGSINATGASQNIELVPSNGAQVDVSNTRIIHVDTAQTATDAVHAELIQFSYLNFGNDGGSANALAVQLPVPVTAYAPGLHVMVKAAASNSGPATIDVNGLGPISIKKNGNQDLASGDIQSNLILSLLFDGTNFQVLSPLNGVNSNNTGGGNGGGTIDPLVFTVDGF